MRKYRAGKSLLSVAVMGGFIFLILLPLNSVGQDRVIMQTPAVKVYRPVKMNPVKVQQLRITRPPPSGGSSYKPYSYSPSVPLAGDDNESLGATPVPPTVSPNIIFQNPPAAGEDETLGNQPGQSHPGRPGCFIATAAYDSPLAEEIVVLERFRDTYLLTNGIGRRFVRFYYKNSPPLADYIAGNEPLRLATRGVLWPLVYGIKQPLYAAIFLLLAGVTSGVHLCRRRHNATTNQAVF
jgi:hypothetical protein